MNERVIVETEIKARTATDRVG